MTRAPEGFRIDKTRGFEVCHRGEAGPGEELVDRFLRAEAVPDMGRGTVRIFSSGGLTLVCRKYLHGGLLRFLTKDLYISAARALGEMETLMHLEESNVPVVHPVAVLTEGPILLKRLFLVTVHVDGATDLLASLKSASRRGQMRLAGRFARTLWGLFSAGVYHPDLHLRNVLVAGGSRLVLLDFDKARRQPVGAREAEKMLWRLHRYAEKMGRSGGLALADGVSDHFARTFDRLSGYGIIKGMERKLTRKRRIYRVGWFFESLLYGGGKK